MTASSTTHQANGAQENESLLDALNKVLQSAVQHHQAGQLGEAESLYRAILDVQPNQPAANHNLGILTLQSNRPDEALRCFAAALEANPERAQYWTSYIDALNKLGRHADARQVVELGRQHGLAADIVDKLTRMLDEAVAGMPSSPPSQPAAPRREEQKTEKAETPASVKRAPFAKAMKTASSGKQKSGGPSASEINSLVALYGQSRFGEMEELAKKLTQRYPRHGFGWKSLGAVLQRQGRLREALLPMQKAAELLPDDAESHNNLGIVLKSEGRIHEAEKSYRRAVALNPAFAQAHNNLGNLLNEQRRFDEAVDCYRRAIQANPHAGEVFCNLGNALIELGRTGEAEDSYRQALQLNPRLLEAYNNLGFLLNNQGRFAEAEKCYRAGAAIDPRYAEILTNLAECLRRQGRLDQAEEEALRALSVKSDLAAAHTTLSLILRDGGRLIEAEACLRKALEHKPDYVDAHNNLGMLLQEQGRHDEAEASYRKALTIDRDSTMVYGNLLFVLNYHSDKSAEEIFQAYREYDSRFGVPLRSTWRPHGNSRDMRRRLKVGYVSPDFRHHSVRHFLEPLLAHHDKNLVEVIAYADLLTDDAVTARYKSYADRWVPTRGMSDAVLAERIREDGVDILVDVAGHTSNNRLAVFARKPAPVSLSWLGYGYTTGLSSVDYYLTDEVSAPPGSEAVFSERPWRLPGLAYCYRPAEGMGDVSRLPAAERGYVTFGTLTRAVRLNHRTIRIWAEILKRVEGSRLVVDSGNFKDEAMQAALAEKFAVHGISRDRLEIGFHSPPWNTLRGMDIGLDCFPHNSGTTLVESLYMGVPYVTLLGRPSVGRLGSAILSAAGYSELIARTEEEYIHLAVDLASDLERLSALREGLRPRLQSSSVMDEVAYARKVESAYLEMFRAWSENGQ